MSLISTYYIIGYQVLLHPVVIAIIYYALGPADQTFRTSVLMDSPATVCVCSARALSARRSCMSIDGISCSVSYLAHCVEWHLNGWGV